MGNPRLVDDMSDASPPELDPDAPDDQRDNLRRLRLPVEIIRYLGHADAAGNPIGKVEGVRIILRPQSAPDPTELAFRVEVSHKRKNLFQQRVAVTTDDEILDFPIIRDDGKIHEIAVRTTSPVLWVKIYHRPPGYTDDSEGWRFSTMEGKQDGVTGPGQYRADVRGFNEEPARLIEGQDDRSVVHDSDCDVLVGWTLTEGADSV